MKKKLLKKVVLFLILGITFSSLPSVLAGGGLSKIENSSQSREIVEQKAKMIFDRSLSQCYAPVIAEDGGKTYFWAWNGILHGKDFEEFFRQYKYSENFKESVKDLLDSPIDEEWVTKSLFDGPRSLVSFEMDRNRDITSYLLRIDKENRIIYTVRKSDNLYLFTFYLAIMQSGQPMLIRTCTVVSSDMRNVKNLLLPIDRELLNQN